MTYDLDDICNSLRRRQMLRSNKENLELTDASFLVAIEEPIVD